MQNDPILATFDTTPSLHRQINAPSLLLAIAHIQTKAGTPALGICSAVVGRNGPFVFMYVQKGRIYFNHAQNPPLTVSTHHCTADAQSWRSRLCLDVGEGQKQTRCIDSPVKRRGGVGWCRM
jgi:hypothetical protein